MLIGYVTFGTFLVVSMPSDLAEVIAQNYVAALIAYFVMAGMAVFILIKHDMDLFDPIVLFSVVYISIFSLAPIRDIIADDYLLFGVNTLVSGVKGIIIAVIGYLAFCAGYLIRDPKGAQVRGGRTPKANDRLIAKRSLAIWFFAFAVALFSGMASGKGATYILSLGLFGDAQANSRMDAPLGFGVAMAHALIPTAIIYSHFGRSRWLNAAVQLLTFSLLASQGFRYIVIIFVLSHAYVWYMSRGTKPRFLTLVGLLAVLLLFSAGMEFYRGALRTGGSVDWTEFGLEELEAAVFGNLGVYKTYYGVVQAVPSLVPYGWGSQIFVYTAVLFVPRLFWPTKPLPNAWEPIRASVSDYAAAAGTAYPNIGEYYYEFGIIGVVTFMGILGVALKTVRARFRYSSDVLDMVLYAVCVTAMFQVIIRGYTPSNFYMLLLLAVPVVVIQTSSRRRAVPAGVSRPRRYERAKR